MTVKEYLERLEWDGKKRVNLVAKDVLGADGRAAQTAVHTFLLNAVRRALDPGCRVDQHLVLVGPQGVGKSRFFQKLFKGWYEDFRFDGGEAYDRLSKAWGVEFDPSFCTKEGLTATKDTFRPRYGKKAVTVPRSFILAGTSNVPIESGRRFAVIECGKIRLSRLNRDQVWAEVMATR